VRALTRREQHKKAGVTWVHGALDHPDTLSELCEGADAVLHVAGVVNAPDAAGFEAGNVTGTANMLAAAKEAGIKRFVHVSSLAAKHPELSMYGASKMRAAGRHLDARLDDHPPAGCLWPGRYRGVRYV
jgi:UDP-glucose 4-epimerase